MTASTVPIVSRYCSASTGPSNGPVLGQNHIAGIGPALLPALAQLWANADPLCKILTGQYWLAVTRTVLEHSTGPVGIMLVFIQQGR